MKIIIDQDTCMGCSICAAMCSTEIEMKEDGRAYAINEQAEQYFYDDIKEAEHFCPVMAIRVL